MSGKHLNKLFPILNPKQQKLEKKTRKQEKSKKTLFGLAVDELDKEQETLEQQEQEIDENQLFRNRAINRFKYKSLKKSIQEIKIERFKFDKVHFGNLPTNNSISSAAYTRNTAEAAEAATNNNASQDDINDIQQQVFELNSHFICLRAELAVLDLSAEFKSFLKLPCISIKNCKSLVQVFFNQNDILDAILKRLITSSCTSNSTSNSTSNTMIETNQNHQSISLTHGYDKSSFLKLLGALLLDLSDSLLDHLPKISNILADFNLDQSQPPHVIKVVYEVIGIVIGIETRPDKAFDLIIPFLKNGFQDSLVFTATVYAPHIRRLNAKTRILLFTHIFDKVESKSQENQSSSETFVDGVAECLAKVINANNGGVQSKARVYLDEIVQACASILLQRQNLDRNSHKSQSLDVVEKMSILVGHHVTPESMALLWPGITLRIIDSQAQDSIAGNSEQAWVYARIAYIWACLRKGVKTPVRQHSDICKSIKILSKSPGLTENPRRKHDLTRFVCGFIIVCPDLSLIHEIEQIATKVLKIGGFYEIIFRSVENAYGDGNGGVSGPELVKGLWKGFIKAAEVMVVEEGVEKFVEALRRVPKNCNLWLGKKLELLILQRFESAISLDNWTEAPETIVLVGQCVECLRFGEYVKESISNIGKGYRKILLDSRASIQTFEKDDVRKLALEILNAHVLEAALIHDPQVAIELGMQQVFQGVIFSPYNPIVLDAAASYLKLILKTDQKRGSLECLDKIESLLEALSLGLGSYHPQQRSSTIAFLQALFSLAFGNQSTEFRIWSLISQIQETPFTIEHDRQFPILLDRLCNALVTGHYSTDDDDSGHLKLRSCVLSFLFALYIAPFQPLRTHVGRSLIRLCESWGLDVVWTVYWKTLSSYLADRAPQEISAPLSLIKQEQISISQRTKSELRRVCTFIENVEKWYREASVHQTRESGLSFHLECFNNLFKSCPDFKAWAVLLIKWLEAVPEMIISYSKHLIPVFENFVVCLWESDDCSSSGASHDLSFTGFRQKILAFLACLAKVRRPRKLHKSEALFNSMIRLLSYRDSHFQTAALACIFTWQIPAITKYRGLLECLGDDDRIRDGLTTFDLQLFRNSLDPKDQEQVLKLIVFLFYGKLVSRHGRSSRALQSGRRIAVLLFMATLRQSEIRVVVDIMLEPFTFLKKGAVEIGLDGTVQLFKIIEGLDSTTLAPLSKQVGFLDLLEDFVKQMQSNSKSFIGEFLAVLVHLVYYADCFVLKRIDAVNDIDPEIEQDYKELEGQAIDQELATVRRIRGLGVKRLSLIFSTCVSFDFRPFLPVIFSSVIDYRVDRLEAENTQGVSALLELFASWSRNSQTVFFLQYNASLLPALLGLCSAKKVQLEVVGHVLSIIENVQDLHANFPELNILPGLLSQHIPLLLAQCKSILESFLGSELCLKLSGQTIPNRIVCILANISVFVKESTVAESLLKILVPFLKAPPQAVPETTKTEILKIFSHFYPILPISKSCKPYETPFYPVICQLFLVLQTRNARFQLLKAFKSLVEMGPELENVAGLLEDLNSMSTKRIDEPDFDRRFSGFSRINQEEYKTLELYAWRPLLYTLFFYVGDTLEYSIRTSAVFGVVRYIERTVAQGASAEDNAFFSYIHHIVNPQIKKGFKSTNELVRNEWVGLWGKLVSSFPNSRLFSDMVPLLGSDQETNFFENIVHIQQHRRLRSMRFLRGTILSIAPSNATHLLSILLHYVFYQGSDRGVASDHNAVTEALETIASVSGRLGWSQYYTLVKRFIKSISVRPELEKTLIRLIVLVLNHFRLDQVLDPQNIETVEDEIDHDVDAIQENNHVFIKGSDLQCKIENAISTELIPKLHKLLAVKNDETLSTRTPLAVAIVKLLLQLADETLKSHLPKMLLTLCNFLSSHLQSSRDVARTTLVTISTMLGPPYLLYIIKGLHSCLTRGYQLHVLGYTLHAIISTNAATYQPGTIDECVEPIVGICMNDIFGETGKEREVRELKGKMREIKQTKSFDTLEQLCKVIKFSQISVLLKPIKEQMLETKEMSVVRQIETLFRRLALGINSNESVDKAEYIEFVDQLLSENLALAQSSIDERPTLTLSEKHVQVVMKRNAAAITLQYYEANVHMFVEFGLSLLLTSLRKGRVGKEEEDLMILNQLVPKIGRALYSPHASIVVLALRVMNHMIKYPLPEMNLCIPVMVKRLFQIVGKSNSTDSELVQAVFKLLASILRDCKHVEIPEKQVMTLLALLTPDLEDSKKQTTTFSLIRAILGRQYVTNEVYDMMEVVSRILVTSQSEAVRELCRNCFIHFLMNYPHGHIRLRKQMAYLVANLEYVFESGRASVLEFFNSAISKFSDEIFLTYSDMLFLAVVMVISNDESSQCREMASKLIKSLCIRLGKDRMTKIVLLLSKWFRQPENLQLHQLSVQIVGILVQVFKEKSLEWLDAWVPEIAYALEKCLEEWRAKQDDVEEVEENLEVWELGYIGLKTWSKVIAIFPKICVLESQNIWVLVSDLLLHPHSWIRLIASQLLGKVFSLIDPSTRIPKLLPLPENTQCFSLLSSNLHLVILAKRLTNQLDSQFVNDALAKQLVQNLVFIGKAMVTFIGDSFSAAAAASEGKGGVEDIEGEKLSSLLWLCKRVCYLARTDAKKKRGTTLRTAVFQWFSAIYVHIPGDYREPFLRLMILTLYHIEKDETLKGAGIEELKQLATQVLAVLQQETGTSEYITIYQSVHESVIKNRVEKRSQRAIQAVSDPKQRALEKIKKTAAKVSSRKRKNAEYASTKMKNSISTKKRTRLK